MSAVRVLQVLGHSAGGIARHVAQVCELLDGRDGLSIEIAGPDILPVQMPKAIHPVTIPRRAFLGHRAAIRRLREIIGAGGYQVVHAHGLSAGIDTSLAARGSGATVITTVHNLVLRETAGRRAIVHRRAEALAVRSSDRIFAVSEQIARHLRASVRDRSHVDKIETLHLGIGPAPQVTRSRAQVRESLGLSAQDGLIVTASRLRPQKALHVMVDALSRLGPTTMLVILGEGPLQEDLEKRASAAGISDRVRFLGFRRDIADFIAAADAFCLSSVWEGVPLAAQEAILLGVPVVATDVGGMRELITDGVSGRLVPSRDANGLANALQEVLATPELRATYAERAAVDLKENFSTDAMLRRLSEVYRGHAVAHV